MPKKRKPGIVLILAPIVVIAIAVLVLFFIDVFNAKVFKQMKLLFTILFNIYVVIAVLVVLIEKRNPQRMISWLLILVLFPGFGLIAYLMFGRSFRKKYRVKNKKMEVYPKWLEDRKRRDEKWLNTLEYEVDDISRSLIKLLQNNSDSKVLLNNKVKVMADGAITFAVMLEELKRATTVINFQFFIVKEDDLGARFKNVLISKAKQGIEVNFLYDAVGSWKLSSAYLDELRDAGVHVKAFLPVLTPFLSRNFNYRNHRKIVTIDGVVGFVGGLNIGDEYVGKKEYFGYWRDTHLMLKGESVYALNNIFLDDWTFSGGIINDLKSHYPKHKIVDKVLMQIVSCGPDSDKHIIMQGYFKMIALAKRSICITSPYLVPEDSLLVAMKTAALSGVEVRIIIPDIADHFMVYWANQSYIQDLLESNVRIFAYKGGFIHSKSLLVDESCASVGTANLDIRSMELNFEVNAFIYDKSVVRELKNDFYEDLRRSEEIHLDEFKKRKLYRKVLEAFGRLVSPLQ
ncbi:MAG: cardiolipin synthase [Clostridiales bacterium]|nr:cardiolipin synthase [Clostridiales bacterium]